MPKAIPTLKDRKDFLAAANSGQKWVSQGVIVQKLANGLDIQRAGYTVSKKISKKAVDRNRIKRRLRALTAEILPEYGETSTDYVLIGRPQTLTKSYDSLKKDLIWCLGKLKEK